MNTDLMFSSAKEDWETPQDFFDNINARFHFTLDVCANAVNHKCPKYFSEEDNGLAQKWTGICWMNPPYGRIVTAKWIKKAYDEAKTGDCVVVGLLPARTDTKWFHSYVYDKPGVEVVFIKGRLQFVGADSVAPFPSIVVLWDFTKQFIL